MCVNFLRNIQVPDGYSSNLSRCADIVNRKLTGLKSHDCHVYLQVLLPLAIYDIVHQDVADINKLDLNYDDEENLTSMAAV